MFKEYRTLVPLLRKYRWFYFSGLLFLILTNAAQLTVPRIITQALDHPDSRAETAAVLAAAALAVAAGRIGWRFFIIGAARRIESELRSRIFSHLTTLSSGFYSRNRTGDLMSRATGDLDAVRMSTGMALVAFVDGVFLTLSIAVILLTAHGRLGAFTMLPLPVITIIILLFGGKVARLFKRVQETQGDLTTQAQEAITGARIVQAFVQEENFFRKFETVNREFVRRNLELTGLWGLFFPVIGLLSGLTTLILLWYGGSLVMAGDMTAGEFAGFLAYLGMLVWPMLGAGMTVNIIQRGAASLGRINEILKTEPEITSPENPRISTGPLTLEVRNLSFTYPGTEVPVIRNLSFRMEEGQILGILGPTGTGKSTLLRLLPRLLDPPPGTVFLSGLDVREWDLARLRRTFAMAPQNPFLFSDTIAGNLSFAAGELSPEEVLKYGRISSLDRDVDTFESRWDTLVGERGITLSGGQKQRLSLARTLASRAPILLLDDTLSSVDMETEERILKALAEEASGRTVILVSHRISTLKLAHRILVIRDGTAVQSGTHRELLSREGPYREIAVLQHQTPAAPEGTL